MKTTRLLPACAGLIVAGILTIGLSTAYADVALQPGADLDDTHVTANIMWDSTAADGNYAENSLGVFAYDAYDGEVFGPPSRLGWVQESMIRFDLSGLTWEGDLDITSATLSVNHVSNPYGGFNSNYYPRETNTLALYGMEADWANMT